MGDKVTFEVQTNESVSSANLILSYGTRTPLDKASDGLFSRSLTLVATGMISVDIELIAMGQVKTYTGVASFEVGEMPMISNVKFQLDPNNGNNLYVSREFIGENVSGFMVHFGTGKDQLDTTITTTGLEILFQNINTMQEYFFQIFPLKGKEPEHGAATEVFTYTPPLSGHSPPS
ncbi:MAG: hypothetical protein LBP53_06975 [Candidatus Peribacteria bacterium]|jgi:hypothetical protein|nr:hypothetical protein [Candidatus Peribacteria bacterium]